MILGKYESTEITENTKTEKYGIVVKNDYAAFFVTRSSHAAAVLSSCGCFFVIGAFYVLFYTCLSTNISRKAAIIRMQLIRIAFSAMQLMAMEPMMAPIIKHRMMP